MHKQLIHPMLSLVNDLSESNQALSNRIETDKDNPYLCKVTTQCDLLRTVLKPFHTICHIKCDNMTINTRLNHHGQTKWCTLAMDQWAAVTTTPVDIKAYGIQAKLETLKYLPIISDTVSNHLEVSEELARVLQLC